MPSLPVFSEQVTDRPSHNSGKSSSSSNVEAILRRVHTGGSSTATEVVVEGGFTLQTAAVLISSTSNIITAKLLA